MLPDEVWALEEATVAPDDLVDAVARKVEERTVGEDDGLIFLIGVREDHRQAGLVDGGEQHVVFGRGRAGGLAGRARALTGSLGQLRPQAQDLCLKLLAREAMQIAIHREVNSPPATDVVHRLS